MSDGSPVVVVIRYITLGRNLIIDNFLPAESSDLSAVTMNSYVNKDVGDTQV